MSERQSLSHSSCVISTPEGFAVYDADGKYVQTYPFGQGQTAFDHAERLDKERKGAS
jgi:hypothetical protein